MSAAFSFKARLLVGSEVVPLASEARIGDAAAQDGTANGFLFRLDLQSEDPPVTIDLGSVVRFVEEKLGAGAGSLAQSPKIAVIQQAFPGIVGGDAPLDGQNDAEVQIRAFEINSSAAQTLFTISLDVQAADPTAGLIRLPAALASWLTIESLALSFTATRTA